MIYQHSWTTEQHIRKSRVLVVLPIKSLNNSSNYQTYCGVSTMRQSCWYHILSLLLVLLLNSSPFYATTTTTSYSESRVVKSLPGFSGDLPFKLHTGYIGVGKDEEVQLFYYFIESKHDSDSDPLMLWLTGGPGCTSMSAIFFEHLGPLSFNYTGIDFNYTTSTWETHLPALQLYPYSWNKFANILFVDSPVGTGFSYAKTEESYHSEDIIASQQLYEFTQKWFMVHPQFATNPFYVGASSFAGVFAPIVTQEIVNGNEAEHGLKINLKGYVLGSPVTDENDSGEIGNIDYSHRTSLLSDELYELGKVSCGPYWNMSNPVCDKNRGSISYLLKSLDNDDILEPACKGSNSSSRCREYDRSIVNNWANNDKVREALHVRKGTVGHIVRCNTSLRSLKVYNHTILSNVDCHQYLSKKPLRVLIYGGDQEKTVSYVGTLIWIRKLSLQIYDNWRPWFVNDQVAGYVTEYSNGLYNLTFTTIKGAGHCASEFKPRECYDMFQRWLASDPF